MPMMGTGLKSGTEITSLTVKLGLLVILLDRSLTSTEKSFNSGETANLWDELSQELRPVQTVCIFPQSAFKKVKECALISVANL